MSSNPVRVAALGMGWWSDVLADAATRSGALEIVSCFTRSEDKRNAFAAKYGCKAAASYDDILADDSIEAVINTTPNHAHLETTLGSLRHERHGEGECPPDDLGSRVHPQPNLGHRPGSG